LEKAVADVPADAAKCTPIALKATAGLRLLGEEKSTEILEAVTRLFEKYPFKMIPNAVAVMDGADEGPYAWLTVNFLLGSLNPNSKRKTSGIIDLGGGSTQLVFAPDSDEILKVGPKESVYDVKYLGRRIRTYQHSYLGLGLKEAQKKVLREGKKSNPTKFPCFHAEHSETVEDTVVTNDGKASFKQCHEVVQKLFDKGAACEAQPCSFNGVFQPSIKKTFSGDMLAFSFYYDRLEEHLPASQIITVGDIRRIGEKVCNEPLTKGKEMHCLDFAYLYSLVSTGYDLPDTHPLHIKKKINGIETAWCLGAMILNM
jgi:guanosine-diphosphatase